MEGWLFTINIKRKGIVSRNFALYSSFKSSCCAKGTSQNFNFSIEWNVANDFSLQSAETKECPHWALVKLNVVKMLNLLV